MRLIADQRRKVPRFRGLYHAAVTILREEVIQFTIHLGFDDDL